MSEILDALGYIGDTLSKPGRAVRGVLAGRPDELAAAIPFSDSLGISDPSQATSGKDLLNALGMDVGSGLGGDLAGFATEVATDPLTWLGAGLGSRLGSAAEKAAVARGPQYGTTAADLNEMFGKYAELASPDQVSKAGRRLKEIVQSPMSDRLMSEIPEGASLLGAGAEGAAFGGPSGVTRLGRVMPGDPGRPAAEGILQALRSTDIPSAAGRGWRSELLPLASDVGDASALRAAVPELDQLLAKQGLNFTDRHAGNFGTVAGRPMVIDPGAVELGKYAGGFQTPIAAGDPSAPMSVLLRLLGAQDAVRAGAPRFAPMMTGLGAFGGADVGAVGRALGQ